jgi:hypothetical protein
MSSTGIARHWNCDTLACVEQAFTASFREACVHKHLITQKYSGPGLSALLRSHASFRCTSQWPCPQLDLGVAKGVPPAEHKQSIGPHVHESSYEIIFLTMRT